MHSGDPDVGILSAILAVLVVAVIVDALRVRVRPVRRPALSTPSGTPYVRSNIAAPAGPVPTREAKEEAARDAVGADAA